jgi:hypothetical protein
LGGVVEKNEDQILRSSSKYSDLPLEGTRKKVMLQDEMMYIFAYLAEYLKRRDKKYGCGKNLFRLIPS